MSADILNTASDGLNLAERHKVLRNTYGLLSISLLPTIFGAWLGSALNFSPVIAGRPFVSFMIFMAVLEPPPYEFLASFGFESGRNNS